MNAMVMPTDQVRRFIAAGDMIAAMRIAKSFRLLKPSQKKVLNRAWQAHTNPCFVTQIKRDPLDDWNAGAKLLTELYGETK